MSSSVSLSLLEVLNNCRLSSTKYEREIYSLGGSSKLNIVYKNRELTVSVEKTLSPVYVFLSGGIFVLLTWLTRCVAEVGKNQLSPLPCHASPSESHDLHDSSGGRRDEYSTNNHFEYKISPILESITKTHNRHLGLNFTKNLGFTSGLKPFLGQSTSTGTVVPLVKFSEKDPMLSKPKTLLEFISWTSTTHITPEGEVLAGYVEELIKYLAGLIYYFQSLVVES